MKILILILSLAKISSFHNPLLAQEIPIDFYSYKAKKIKNDIGLEWQNITTFGPLREVYIDSSKSDSLKVKTRLGLSSFNNDLAIYGYEHFLFQKYFYAFLHFRIVTNPNVFPRYTGISQEIDRFGFSSGETDLSGVGFENNWSILQIGRGRQSWGAGNDIQLALSEMSPSYDYHLIGLNLNKIRYRYFHAFLESDSLGMNRYLTAKGIEYSNLESMVISFSELVIYSGINRSIDHTYLNPLSSHLEIELNDRQNLIGTDNGNAVWQASLDLFFLEKFRFSLNLLFDELVFDASQRDLGKKNRTAYSGKVCYNYRFKKNSMGILYLSILNVDPLTFRHGNGSNNFVSRGKPLGWQLGSDGYEVKIGLNQIYKHKIIANLEIGFQSVGVKSIFYDSYRSHIYYSENNNPVNQNNIKDMFINGHIEWWIRPEIAIQTSLKWVDYDAEKSKIDFNLGVNIFLPKSFSIK